MYGRINRMFGPSSDAKAINGVIKCVALYYDLVFQTCLFILGEAIFG